MSKLIAHLELHLGTIVHGWNQIPNRDEMSLQ
jgi:hypothetical protein